MIREMQDKFERKVRAWWAEHGGCGESVRVKWPPKSGADTRYVLGWLCYSATAELALKKLANSVMNMFRKNRKH
jgi:hypothetical protein